MSKVVFITGCSSGIGRDLVERLTRSGYAVAATARQVETLDDLPAALKLPLDVTQQDSVNRAVDQTLERLGGIDVLVNNAGYAQRGAVEDVSDEKVQKMFDVNVHGVIRMIRAVAPHMRRQGSGRIINIGSLAGKLAIPVNGIYSASKFALEALSDASRLELIGFGIQVVLIEPGNIRTSFRAAARVHADAIYSGSDSPYHALYQQYLQVEIMLRKQEAGPEMVSKVVQQSIEVGKPKARYRVAAPLSNRVMLLLGDPARDLILKRLFKIAAPERQMES